MHLEWEIQRRGNTRSCQFSKKDMIAALEREGCIVKDHKLPFLLLVTRPLQQHEDPKTVRKNVTRMIRIVHPRASKIFKGLKS